MGKYLLVTKLRRTSRTYGTHTRMLQRGFRTCGTCSPHGTREMQSTSQSGRREGRKKQQRKEKRGASPNEKPNYIT